MAKDQSLLYLDSIQPLLPDVLKSELGAVHQMAKLVIDTMLRLVVGADAPVNGLELATWGSMQANALKTIDDLKRGDTPSSNKRPREDDGADSESSKKAKISTEDGPSTRSPVLEDDPPLFTLHALSATTPVRKKVDITVHSASIRLTNPISHALEHPPIPFSSLRRAFLLPTRGKTKPHWTVVLLPSDTPSPAGKPGVKDAQLQMPQIIFGVDATLPSLTTTAHDLDAGPTSTSHPKGTASLPSLRTFLSHLPFPVLEPSTTVFRSAVGGTSGDGVAGVDGYRGAKPGTLWFLDEGVLWDGRPCEFFPLADLAGSGSGREKARDIDAALEGVRTLTATGRTCSVILRRIVAKGEVTVKGKGKARERSEESEEEEEYLDVDFGMVDGKEQEPIARWIKSHRHLFGKRDVDGPSTSGDPATERRRVPPGTAAGAGDVDLGADDSDDSEDSDFVGDDSDDSSGSDDSSDESEGGRSGEGDGQGGGSDEGNASDAMTEDEIDDEDEEDLKPEHHPLLRPGAMPRMSRAAMDAVVGMVEQDLMNGGRTLGEMDDDEEDELDD